MTQVGFELVWRLPGYGLEVCDMNTLKIILTIVQVLSAVALTVIVLFQSGKESGLSGAIAGGGGGDSFLARNKRASLDAKLATCTKWVAAVFVILTFVLNLI